MIPFINPLIGSSFEGAPVASPPSPPLRMTDEGREPWSRYVDLLIQEIDRLAGAASEDESCRQPNLSSFGRFDQFP